MEMEVRCFLPAKDPVVLKCEYSEGPISLDERLCDSLGRGHYGPAFLVRKIEQRRDMPTRDNATLANLELPGIDHGERMFAFIHDRPSFFAPCHPLAKVARISYGKLDQLPSPIQPARTIVVSAARREPPLRSDRCRPSKPSVQFRAVHDRRLLALCYQSTEGIEAGGAGRESLRRTPKWNMMVII